MEDDARHNIEQCGKGSVGVGMETITFGESTRDFFFVCIFSCNK